MKEKNFQHLYNYGDIPKEANLTLKKLFDPHKEAFNFAVGPGLTHAVQDLLPEKLLNADGKKVTLRIKRVTISKPMVNEKNAFSRQLLMFPVECREGGTTYQGNLEIDLDILVEDTLVSTFTRQVGQAPIMVQSELCNLHGLSPKELVKKKEDHNEMGGYFVINGNEKVVRMLVNPRRHFPYTVKRTSYKNKGPNYTEFAVQIRCARLDQTSQRLTLHYLTDGQVILNFTYNKALYFIPVVLIMKSLVAVTDKEVYEQLVEGHETDKVYCNSIASMLRTAQTEAGTYGQIRSYLGELFRIKLSLPEWYTDEEVCVVLLNKFILVHLTDNLDKFNLLVFMVRKLYSFKDGKCAEEGADNPMMHEVMLGGHLYLALLKERCEIWLRTMRTEMEKMVRQSDVPVDVTTDSVVNRIFSRLPNIGQALQYFLATGNLKSQSGLDMQQISGFSIVGDKLNYQRWLSHFRCIHRGAFFTEMRTTTVRKLRPEAWGFICPIHTPDGTPCGLLNHLSASCTVVTELCENTDIQRHLISLGVYPISGPRTPGSVPVMLEGVMFGTAPAKRCEQIVTGLRYLKVNGRIPESTEVVYLPVMKAPGQYPGLFIFTGPTRMVRPVRNVGFDKTEMIGTFEQVYLHVCITPEEFEDGITTHQELSPINMLSALGQLIPYSNFNPSPRNMYQLQMGKQTMGMPSHTLDYRSDSKAYKLETPQYPLVRPSANSKFDMDEFPSGTNAIVAVISYTGYDMEDAMIINKSSYERGFAHANILKSHVYDMTPKGGKNTEAFGFNPATYAAQKDEVVNAIQLDSDGLPPIGTKLEFNDPMYATIDLATGKCTIKRYQGLEPAYVHSVRALGNDLGTGDLHKICMTLRSTRNPTIGDKFASRHGQKGVCSMLWPAESLPFTEGGMVPDILFNPHGYPSRMTIGMMIETMAGKACAVHGIEQDCTPFLFSEENRADDHVGEMLRQAGYNYFGTETMYSGQTGEEFEAQIFIGVVYYQRLRHMVSDKYQVRTTGPVDQLTRQPIKGRKKAGGIRFGEMERDALLSHGTAFLLNDRLLNCSDVCVTHVCKTCGKTIGVYSAASFKSKQTWKCRLCKDKSEVVPVKLPYVYNYLTAELASMNISLSMKLT